MPPGVGLEGFGPFQGDREQAQPAVGHHGPERWGKMTTRIGSLPKVRLGITTPTKASKVTVLP